MAISISIDLGKNALHLPYSSAPYLHDAEDEESAPSPIETHEITAMVVVKVSKTTKISALKADFISQQFIQDEELECMGSSELFFQSISLIPKVERSSSSYLTPGTHTFEACFIVPSWLPATFANAAHRVQHRVLARLELPNNSYFPLTRKAVHKAIRELVVIRDPPMTLNALRYWSGQRASAATSIAVKAAKFARVGGKLKVSLRIKSTEQLEACKIDIVQEETCCNEVAHDSIWPTLPGVCTDICVDNIAGALLHSRALQSASIKRRKFPLPTISTTFPEPDNVNEHGPRSATLSTVSLQFPLVAPDLYARYESPLLSIDHKLRVRIRFRSQSVKEIVVNIPVTLFNGPASCDDIPPYYEDIHMEDCGMRSRSDSVATLPLYTPKDSSLVVAQPTTSGSDDNGCVDICPDSTCTSEDNIESFLRTSNAHMAPPMIVA